jgi:hypothetical protein
MKKNIIQSAFWILICLTACTNNIPNPAKTNLSTVDSTQSNPKDSATNPTETSIVEEEESEYLPKIAEKNPKQFVRIRHSDEKTITPKLTPFSKQAFDALADGILPTPLKYKTDNNFLYVNTKTEKLVLEKYKNRPDENGGSKHEGYEFLGKYPKIDLFAFIEHSSAEGLGFSQFYLLDDSTQYAYELNACCTDGVGNVYLLSTNAQYIASFVNDYDNSSHLEIFKINSKTNPKTYIQYFAYLQNENFQIAKIKWIDEQNLAIQTFEDGSLDENNVLIDNKKPCKYYKVSF